MNIVHLPLNIADYASRLAEGQRRLGHRVTVFSRPMTPYDFSCDVKLPAWHGPVFRNLALLQHWKTLRDVDIIHVHGGLWRTDVFYSLLRRVSDARLVVHYHGTEARTGKGLFWQNLANVQFYATPDLKHWVPRGIWLPQPVSLPPLPLPPDNPKAVFIHFNPRANKGYQQVVDVFKSAFGAIPGPVGRDSVKWVGKDAELRVYGQIPHKQVLEAIALADVVFDQMTTPARGYGYIGVEGMALGKPVLATLDRRLYPADCPVLTPRKTKLMELARRSNYYGELGRAYVERVHETSVVAEKALKYTFK